MNPLMLLVVAVALAVGLGKRKAVAPQPTGMEPIPPEMPEATLPGPDPGPGMSPVVPIIEPQPRPDPGPVEETPLDYADPDIPSLPVTPPVQVPVSTVPVFDPPSSEEGQDIDDPVLAPVPFDPDTATEGPYELAVTPCWQNPRTGRVVCTPGFEPPPSWVRTR